MNFAFGCVWGFVLLCSAIIANQNYETLKTYVNEAGQPLILMGMVGFILVSLLILGVMLLSGLLQLLAGRRMKKRWAALIGVGIGSAVASMTLAYSPVIL